MNKKYQIFNYFIIGTYVVIIILFWFFSRKIEGQLGSLIYQYGLIALLIISLLIEILPSAISPPSLLIICNTMGISTLFSVSFMTLGAMIGGLISFHIGRKAGIKVVNMFVKEKDIDKLQRKFEKYGSYALLLVSISPIPDYPIFFGSLGMSWKTYFIYGFFFRIIAFAFMGYLFATAGRFIF